MLTYGSAHCTDDTKTPMSGKRPATVCTQAEGDKACLLPPVPLAWLLPSSFMASPVFLRYQGDRLEWALWLVNKFSDSGGGQLQPC